MNARLRIGAKECYGGMLQRDATEKYHSGVLQQRATAKYYNGVPHQRATAKALVKSPCEDFSAGSMRSGKRSAPPLSPAASINKQLEAAGFKKRDVRAHGTEAMQSHNSEALLNQAATEQH